MISTGPQERFSSHCNKNNSAPGRTEEIVAYLVLKKFAG